MKMKSLIFALICQSSSLMLSKPLLIFDFDGTLVDSWSLVSESIISYANYWGFKNTDQSKITKDTLEGFRSMEAEMIAQKLGMSIGHVAACCLYTRWVFWKYYNSVKLIDGIKDMLLSLKDSGFRFAILSSNYETNIRSILEREGILNIFERIHTTSIRNVFNKTTEIINLLEIMNVKPENAAYLGDEISDIKAASHKDLRLKFIGAGWKEAYNTKKSLKIAAENYGYIENKDFFIANNPDEIINIVSQY